MFFAGEARKKHPVPHFIEMLLLVGEVGDHLLDDLALGIG